MDADGAVWTPSWYENGPCCLRVANGGEVLDRIPLEQAGFACALGGPDGRTLAMLSADWHMDEDFTDNLKRLTEGTRTGQLHTTTVVRYRALVFPTAARDCDVLQRSVGHQFDPVAKVVGGYRVSARVWMVRGEMRQAPMPPPHRRSGARTRMPHSHLNLSDHETQPSLNYPTRLSRPSARWPMPEGAKELDPSATLRDILQRSCRAGVIDHRLPGRQGRLLFCYLAALSTTARLSGHARSTRCGVMISQPILAVR